MGILSTYAGSIFIGALLIVIIALIVASMVKKARRGQSIACNCSDGCNKENCHCENNE